MYAFWHGPLYITRPVWSEIEHCGGVAGVATVTTGVTTGAGVTTSIVAPEDRYGLVVVSVKPPPPATLPRPVIMPSDRRAHATTSSATRTSTSTRFIVVPFE